MKTTPDQWQKIRAAIRRHCPESQEPCFMCRMYLDVLDDLENLLAERAANSQGRLAF